MQVVLYMRYSSDRQTEQSIEGQERVCREFCTRQGYEIIDMYIDRGTSAFKNTEKRTSFNKMMVDSARGLFEGVVVYKLDRFARNRYDSAIYRTKLKKNGVALISATENISDNPEGIILESVLEGMAEFYSKELSQKITRGMNESAHKCNSTGGQLPLGYKIEGKKMVIDPLTAPIVKEAFERYAEGETISDICKDFNQRGFKTAKGGEYNKSSFARMFRNERYIGTYKYKDIKVPNGQPAIITKELFDKVNYRLGVVHSAPARGKAKVDYLLAGKVICGECGENYNGMTGTSRNGTPHYYYACHGARQHKCDMPNIQKEKLEQRVIADLRTVLDNDMISTISKMAVEESKRLAKEDSALPLLEDELKDTRAKINNLLKALEIAPDVNEISDRIKTLSTDAKHLEKRIEQEKSSQFILTEEQVATWFKQFALDDKRIIQMLINKVVIYRDKTLIIYNLSSNNPEVDGSFLKRYAPPFITKANTVVGKYLIRSIKKD